MIDRKSRIVFEISRPENIPQKWFSTQNEPLDVSFQMRLTPTMGAFYFLRKKTVTIMQCFKVFLKDCNVVFACFCPEIRTVHGWGQSHLKTEIQRSVLSTEPLFRDIFGPRYLKNNPELLVNH